MRDESAKGIPVEIDWSASAWSFTEVFNAFLLLDFDLAGKSKNIVEAINKDNDFNEAGLAVVRMHQKLRELIKNGNIVVQMKTRLHPAVWLRLAHFISEGTGLHFKTMESSYLDWRKSNGNTALVIRRQNPETMKWRSCAMDVFLLQKIDDLDLAASYKWGKFSAASPTLEKTEEINRSEPIKRPSKATLENIIKKIGKEVCRNVEEMLANYKNQRIPNLSPMRVSSKSKSARAENRKYQYQGSALKLTHHLKSQTNSPISQRSDAVVAKAVRLYVKCS